MFFLILMNILTNIHSIMIDLLIVKKELKIRVFFISDIKNAIFNIPYFLHLLEYQTSTISTN